MMQLQYISQGNTPKEHLINIGEVCEAGGRWIQLRLKDVDLAVYLETAIKCREICDQYGAIMIVNDQVSIAQAAQADGVHLGLNDMSPKEARGILGENFIIGGTANTIQDCMDQVEAGVDYVGLGPYKNTITKKKLSPLLGTKGYASIMTVLRNKYPEVPVVAIGGILLEDISPILESNVNGIAVSGMLTKKDDLEERIQFATKLIAEKKEAKS
ncbi:thiamine phosphate synthase [Aquimarina sp. 2201CG14-23]|uniref:thiamine phosphate synthase n=1 Tax=Aquimarina mycalae TaxID=3040073 RepID=UPI002477D9FC|nr:thiamine phosphate synthase [Aquimarina sp. 2201CG14-23]MDH7446055.1 thiamine phosphate synthase [Aquimarina sp. 2201CG14-23]